MYDFLIVGAGLFGATFANVAAAHGKKCLVIDKKPHIAGACYTENNNGITVHKFGAHIVHTGSLAVWQYINTFDKFNGFKNEPLAKYGGQVFNLPFNMNTFARIFGVSTPAEAREAILEDTPKDIGTPRNLEEKAISLVGRKIYEMLIKGYTEKQWGAECSSLPPEIITRLPLRFVYDNNYFNDEFQGIPQHGYTEVVKNMLDGIEVSLATPFSKQLESLAKYTIFTGRIDRYFGCCFGELPFRSLRFDEVTMDVDDFQGNAVCNYTEAEIPWTRIIEHKHFDKQCAVHGKTIVSYEFPQKCSGNIEPLYPINNAANNALYERYVELAKEVPNVVFCGRCGSYRYNDMDDTIEAAFTLLERMGVT